MRSGLCSAVAACLIAAATRGHAGVDHLDVDASFVVASQNGSMSSGGMLGGSLGAVRWFGRLGVGAEAGIHDWDPEGDARWLGGSVRLALVDVHTRQRSGHLCGVRVWLDAGASEKWWRIGDFEGTRAQVDVYYHGPRAWLGLGFDLDGGDRWHGGMTSWFRVERGHRPDLSAAPFDSSASDFPPPATEFVLGYAFYFGGPV